MNSKELPGMTDFETGADSGMTRHSQWRKLSRKRRRTLILRSLRRLEKEAKRKSVHVGLEDYSHVQSLVLSDLPFNPNGHHCSCNCLDDVKNDPELEVNGWNYGKLLKKAGSDDYHDLERDDLFLRSSNDSEISTSANGRGLDGQRSIPSTGRSYMSGYFDLKTGSSNGLDQSGTESVPMTASVALNGQSRGDDDRMRNDGDDTRYQESPQKQISAHGDGDKDSKIFSLSSSRKESRAACNMRCNASDEKMKRDEIEQYSNLSSPRKQCSSHCGSCRHFKSGSMTGRSRQGCFCKSIVSRGNNGRASVTSDMMKVGLLSRSVCSRCQNLFNLIDSFRNQSAGRRISLAKDGGSLRSRIFGLRQKLRHYNDLIERRDYLAVQERIKRKLTIGDQLQMKALNLSDSMKLMKIQQSLYRGKNMELQKRLSEDDQGSTEYDWQNEKEGDEKWKKQLATRDKEMEEGKMPENFEQEDSMFATANAFNRSPRKAGRRLAEKELPTLQEEDEENLRETHSSSGRIEHNKKVTRTKKERRESYDILFINHSDNEVEGQNVNGEESTYNEHTSDDDDDHHHDSDDDGDDDDILMKSWPAYKSNSLKLYLWKQDYANGKSRNWKEADLAEKVSVRRLVHRLDSGLSFGSTETGILKEDSLKDSINKVEEEKAVKGNLPESEYYKPLVERQRSFGQVIREVIRQEVQKKGTDRLHGSRTSEDESEKSKWRESVKEENVKELTIEAQEKRERLEKNLSERDSGVEELKRLTNEGGFDKDDQNSLKKKSKKPKLIDLSTLRTLAEKHKTLKSLRELDEEMYEVGKGVDKLNNYRMKESSARIMKRNDTRNDHYLPLSKEEVKYSIPDAMNRKSVIKNEIADNNKSIAKIDFSYDLVRDLRFLILNQNTNRPSSYSYFKPAPPYLKTKWQHRIKRGFLRGVKEQKVNEVQLEKVENVTYKTINRSEIHKETLKKEKALKEKQEEMRETGMDSRPQSKLSNTTRHSSVASKQAVDNSGVRLPPLKLPNSRASSPVDSLLNESVKISRSMSPRGENLRQTFKKLESRHKYLEKVGMMKNVIRLSSYAKNDAGEDMSSFRQDTDRSRIEGEAEEIFTSRLKSNRRRSVAAVQNIAARDPMTGRMSVNSNEGRRINLIHPIKEY